MAENRSVGGLPNNPLEHLKKGKNYLFAIGINKYQHFTPLSNASKDIEDLAAILMEFYEFEHQEILLDEDATRSNIINKLNDLPEKVAPEDKLLIYYSGHGKLEENDNSKQRGYWIPVDGKPDDVSSYVTNADVRDIIKTIDARHILLISDSCFSASLLVTGRAADSYDGAYEDMELSKSRWAFISGKGVVSDGDSGKNSPFASGIIKQLKKADDKINISLLADQVTKDISLNYEQQAIARPIFATDSDGGQFVFVKKQTEKDVWEWALSQNTAGSYVEYKNKYPEGKFVIEAKQKLKDLGDEEAWASVLSRNSAYDYDDYLDKYPDGLHAAEAKLKLEEIAKEDRLESKKATARKQEQELQFRLAAEKKEKADPTKQASDNPPIQPKATLSVPPPPKKTEVVKPAYKINYSKYILLIIGTFIAVYGGYIWFSNHSKPAESEKIAEVTPAPTPAETVLTDDSREIEGKVLGVKNTLIPLKGATVTNKRNSLSFLTDEVGNYKLAQTKDGDTLLTTYNDEYYESINIVEKDQKSIVISLKPIIRVNKTITGIVEDMTGNPFKYGAWVYVERNGKSVKGTNGIVGTKTNPQGRYTLTKVNEGDLLTIDIGTRKYRSLVTKDNMYNIINGNEITGSH